MAGNMGPVSVGCSTYARTSVLLLLGLRGTYFMYQYCGGNVELKQTYGALTYRVNAGYSMVAEFPRRHGQVLGRRLATCIVKDKLRIALLPCDEHDEKFEYGLTTTKHVLVYLLLNSRFPGAGTRLVHIRLLNTASTDLGK
jgi:hypothetical protein